MATLLKPKQEKPATLRFSCSQSLAARLKKLENAGASQGVEIDLDAALSALLEKLVAQAERELLPPPAPVQAVAASSSSFGDAPSSAGGFGQV